MGDLSPRYPYETFRIYYYDRPYNAGQEKRSRPDHWSANPGLPYSNQIFEDVFERFNENFTAATLAAVDVTDDASLVRNRPNAVGANGVTSNGVTSMDGEDSIVRDKYLEYSDWQQYRAARLAWIRDRNTLESPDPPDLDLPPAPKSQSTNTPRATTREDFAPTSFTIPGHLPEPANKPAVSLRP